MYAYKRDCKGNVVTVYVPKNARIEHDSESVVRVSQFQVRRIEDDTTETETLDGVVLKLYHWVENASHITLTLKKVANE